MRTLILCLLWLPTLALAWGPGVHMMESDRTLELLLEDTPAWGEGATDHAYAEAMLHFGSFGPDLQHLSDTLNFGHAKGLSLYLFEAVPPEHPEYLLFALGHLAHTSSDGAAEAFFSPAMWALNPLGVYDLFDDDAGVKGEAEALCEGFGDLVLTDWSSVIDMLYDFFLEDDAAHIRGYEVVTWYCETGAAYHDRRVDCEQVWIEIEDRLGSINGFLGDANRETAQRLVSSLVDRPPAQLVGLITGGLLDSFAGETGGRSEHFTTEAARFRAGPLVDADTWTLYEQMRDLGPTWAVTRLRTGDTGWPHITVEGLGVGNMLSVMQFAPDRYNSGRGLLLDDLRWHDATGARQTEVSPDALGAELAVTVRLYGALPLQGVLRGVVRKDHAGPSDAEDEVLGEATLVLDIDPLSYVTTPRAEFTVPFTADGADALGYYLELYLDDEPRPWFTTSWDHLWQIEALPLFWEMYRDTFGSYRRFFSGLPLATPDTEVGALFVTVRFDDAEQPITSAQITIDETTVTVGGNGIAPFYGLSAGTHSVMVEAPGLPTLEAEGAVEVGTIRWLDLRMRAMTLHVEAPLLAGACVPFSWALDLNPMAAPDAIEARLVDATSGAPLTELERFGPGDVLVLCDAPAHPFAAIWAQVRLAPEAAWIEGTSGPVVVDPSPPQFGAPVVEVVDDAPCYEAIPMRPTLTVRVQIEDESPLLRVEWRLGEGAWQTTILVNGAVELHLDRAAPEGPLTIRAENVVEGSATLEIPLPVRDEAWRCAPDTGAPDAGPAPDAAAPAPAPDDGGDGGCQAGTTPAPATPWLLLTPLLLCRRRR